MEARLLDGAALARRVRERVAGEVAELKARGVTPGLSVVLVGDDPASAVYVHHKTKDCQEVGMRGEQIRMPASTSQDELLAVVDRLNGDPAVHGILVQMPVPKQIDPAAVIARIAPEKDVDGFHPVNVGKTYIGEDSGFAPCTPAGVMVMLREAGVDLRGAEVVIIGRSNIVGKPMAALLVQPGVDATVTVCHSRTRDLAAHTRRADVIVAAIGRARFVTGDMVKPGAVVIDVGMNRIDDPTTKSGTRLVGDVDFEAVRQVASAITPVPGGVGPMTRAMLLENTVRAARRAAGA
ncbi:Bifunctional protein folD [Gemmatirosa kalamazoonensis]|uniref:Bifunctional protein FolD n=1 Tax=Gemmatirosa kalamazoonensis TaxID=861299 RepID=W0RKL2_9BACT|nr:bifunctional methylenetetrahydrofolate dehydrogenase/methenyltetrahydrofolate cyclohydrolase FolD [Gemmatirosa kalamazoonensis]AHG90977.1 Bifunctional protein folD [Gemmatirosa kalamazoonensis]